MILKVIIIIAAAVCAVFLIIFGAVQNKPEIMSTGVGILGVLLGYIGAKNEPAVVQGLKWARCKIGFHPFFRQLDGAFFDYTCTRPGCHYKKSVRL